MNGIKKEIYESLNGEAVPIALVSYRLIDRNDLYEREYFGSDAALVKRVMPHLLSLLEDRLLHVSLPEDGAGYEVRKATPREIVAGSLGCVDDCIEFLQKLLKNADELIR